MLLNITMGASATGTEESAVRPFFWSSWLGTIDIEIARWTANSDEIWLNLRRACPGSKPDTLLPVFWQLIVLTVRWIVLREVVLNFTEYIYLNTSILNKPCPVEVGSKRIMKIQSTRVETWSWLLAWDWGRPTSVTVTVVYWFDFDTWVLTASCTGPWIAWMATRNKNWLESR